MFEVPCFPHVYLESVDASADDIAACIRKTCDEVAADMLVVAHREKVRCRYTAVSAAGATLDCTYQA
jgi:hypothetical protein